MKKKAWSNDENCGKSLDIPSKLENDVSRLEKKNTRVESRVVAWIEKKLSELQEKRVDEQMIKGCNLKLECQNQPLDLAKQW